jgi:GNAT superfamily N-acetyltransferase
MEGARPAQPEDAERCAELCREALDAIQQQRGGSLFVRKEAGLIAKALMRPGGLLRLIDDARHRVLVGTVDGSVVGLAVGRIDPVGEASIGVVDALYVEPACRGIGVGRELLQAVVAWFEASGCRSVDAAALPGDREAKNFFEGSGFKARLLTMHLPLG